ncbi:hypothetical protein [Arthrobacter sp. Rue61a]|uniref:hypothetical protein n=1 Tax=Arthrobacter sp. Rue61a TaxID=1118963 RepID=UPI001392250E|nr:hypothetical protein [Arthrobacter sp. Rue61a]
MNRLVFPRALSTISGRLSLLLLVAAVIAGIFGMHVVSGSHGVHSADSVSPEVAPDSSPHAHASSQLLHGPSPAEADRCTSGGCSCVQADNANCIPSLKTGSLAAPPPGTAVAIISATRGHQEPPPFWSYRPDAPTPGQLSISRT